MKCEGACAEHIGEVVRVRVYSRPPHFKDWGAFNYCATAIAEDTGNGFTVIPVDATPTDSTTEQSPEVTAK